MNVALVHDSNVFGGMEAYMLRLARFLSASHYRPHFLIPGYNDVYRASPQRLIDEANALGIPVLQPPHPGDIPGISTLKDIINIRRAFKHAEIDVAHIHTNHPESARKMMIAARLAGIRAIVRTEHLPPSFYGHTDRLRSIHLFDRYMDRLITVSEANRREQVELFKRDARKTVCIHCGIELERFNPCHDTVAAKRSLGLDPTVPVVGMVGRLCPQKGQSYLLDAAARVIRQVGEVNFLLVGEGPDEPDLRAMAAELGIHERVHFAGFQSDPVPYMEAMDIAVLSSISEGLPLTLMEYMTLQKACVVTDLPCYQGVVEDHKNGIIVAMKSGEAFAEGLVSVLEDPLLRSKLAVSARLFALQMFSMETNTRQTLALYDSLLA